MRIGKALLGFAVAGAVLMPVAARAAAPTDLVVSQKAPYHLSADWALPPGMESRLVEISTSSDTSPDGSFKSALFSATLTATQITYDSPPVRPGTYYVHVAAVPAGCAPACVSQFSDTKPFTIPSPPAPVLNLVRQTSRHLIASWSLAPGAEINFIEASTRQETDNSGDFLVENSALLDLLDPGATSYTSTEQLKPGFYYVHVAAYDPLCPFILSCPDVFSNMLPVVIPPDSRPQQALVRPHAPADRVTSFSALKCASTQKPGNLVVRASMPEDGTITVGGSVSVPNAAKVFSLKAVSVRAAGGKVVKINLKTPPRILKAIRKALTRHVKVKASLTIIARDAAGNTKIEKRAVKIKGR